MPRLEQQADRRRTGRLGLLASLPALCLLPLLSGCATMGDDRVRDFTEDGIYLFRKGDYTAAREDFEYALKLKPNDPSLLYNIGQCFDRQGADAKAEESYRECLQHKPNQADCRHALALLLLRQGRRADFDQLVEGWLTDEPTLADAYAEDGWRLRQDGDLKGAQGRLQQALSLDPHNVRALTELGILYEQHERPDLALALYEQAAARDPGQEEVMQRVSLLKSKGVGKPLPD